MPIMPNGTFKNIDEVKGNLRFAENVKRAIRTLGGNIPSVRQADAIKKLDAEAAELRAIVDEYEGRMK